MLLLTFRQIKLIKNIYSNGIFFIGFHTFHFHHGFKLEIHFIKSSSGWESINPQRAFSVWLKNIFLGKRSFWYLKNRNLLAQGWINWQSEIKFIIIIQLISSLQHEGGHYHAEKNYTFYSSNWALFVWVLNGRHVYVHLSFSRLERSCDT